MNGQIENGIKHTLYFLVTTLYNNTLVLYQIIFNSRTLFDFQTIQKHIHSTITLDGKHVLLLILKGVIQAASSTAAVLPVNWNSEDRGYSTVSSRSPRNRCCGHTICDVSLLGNLSLLKTEIFSKPLLLLHNAKVYLPRQTASGTV